MKTKFLYSLLVYIPILIIQITLITFVTWNSIAPNFILILLVFYTIKNNQLFGTVLGFTYGLLLDLFTGGLLGSAMLSFTVSGFIAGYFSNENKRHIYFKPLNFSLIVLLCAIISSIMFSFFSTIDFSRNIFTSIFEDGLLPGFYSAIVALILIYFYPRRKLIES